MLLNRALSSIIHLLAVFYGCMAWQSRVLSNGSLNWRPITCIGDIQQDWNQYLENVQLLEKETEKEVEKEKKARKCDL